MTLKNAISNAMLALVLAAGSTAALAQRDCSKAREGARAECEVRAKAEKKCEALKGGDRRKCMRDELPRDCAKSDNKARCEAEVAQHKSCRSKGGDDYRKCMSDK